MLFFILFFYHSYKSDDAAFKRAYPMYGTFTPLRKAVVKARIARDPKKARKQAQPGEWDGVGEEEDDGSGAEPLDDNEDE